MPTTTDSGFVIPSSGSEPADMYGVATRLGNSAETVINPTYTDVTYSNSWTDFGSPYEETSVGKVGNDIRLRGMSKHATAGQTGVVCNLPDGYRPTKTRHFKLDAGAGWALVTIDSGGDVTVVSYVSGGTAAHLSFDGVSFDNAA